MDKRFENIEKIEKVIETYSNGLLTSREAFSQIMDISREHLLMLKEFHDSIYNWLSLNVTNHISFVLDKNDENAAIYQFIELQLTVCFLQGVADLSYKINGCEFYKWFLDQEQAFIKSQIMDNRIKRNEKQNSI